LETLGVARTSHGGLLGSRILRSIPLKLQAEWTKTATNKVTDIDQVLKFIEEQVEAAERLNRLRAQTPKPVQNSQQPAKAAPTTTPTASQLGVSSKPTPHSKSPSRPRRNGSPPPRREVASSPRKPALPCVFCKEMHWATNCPMELKEKKAIITNQKRCSNCFGHHETIDCFNPHRCQRCGA
jgi:hypothetical protein